MQNQKDHGDCSDETPGEEWDAEQALNHVGEVLLGACVDGPSGSVGDALQDNNPAQPSVKKVVCVEADAQKRDQRVVAPG